MTIRALLTKINNTIRPPHVKGQGSTYDPLDARVMAFQAFGGANAANAGHSPPTGAAGGTPITGWVPSQQEEKPE